MVGREGQPYTGLREHSGSEQFHAFPFTFRETWLRAEALEPDFLGSNPPPSVTSCVTLLLCVSFPSSEKRGKN